MQRKGPTALLVTVVAVVLPAAWAGATARSAAAKAITFKGAVRCAAKGTMTLSPAYTLSGTNKKSRLKISLSLSACGGAHPMTQHGVTITGGSFSGSIVTPNNSCAALASKIPALAGKATFKAKKGTVTPVSVVYSDGAAAFSHPPVVLKFPLKGGKVKQSGSFAGTKGSMALTLQLSPSAMLAQCQSSSGLGLVHFPKGDIIFN